MKKALPILTVMMIMFVFLAAASAGQNCATDKKGAENCPRMHHPWTAGDEGADTMQGVCGIKYHRLMQLDLSDAQKTEVANLLAAHRDNSRALADQLQTDKTTFFELVHGDVAPTEAALRQAFKDMSLIKEDMMVNKFNIMSALKNILTEDQFTELTAWHAGKPEKGTRPRKMKKAMETHRDIMDTWIDDHADN